MNGIKSIDFDMNFIFIIKFNECFNDTFLCAGNIQKVS